MALEFDGTTQYISIAQTKDLPIYNEITYSVCGWVKIFGGQFAKRWFAERSTSDADPSFLIGSGTTNYENKVRIFIENDAAAILLATNSTTTVCDDTWHHFCWVDNNGDADLYIDGVLDATNFNYTRSGTFTLNTTTIGAALGTTLDFLVKGQLSDFRCYNRCLSANEISEIYHHRGSDKVWQGLVGWWRMDEMPGGQLTQLPYTMTSNNIPSPQFVSASHEYKGWEAWRAIFGSGGSFSSYPYGPADEWWKIDLGSGNERAFTSITYDNAWDKGIKTGYIQASNNDSDWTTLYTDSGDRSRGVITISFSNSTAYRYWRLYALTGYGANSIQFSKLRFYLTSTVDLSGNGNHGTPYRAPIYRDSPHRLRRGVIIT